MSRWKRLSRLLQSWATTTLSRRHFLVVSLFLTLTTTVILLVAVSPGSWAWDITVYDVDFIERNLTLRDAEQGSNGTGLAHRFELDRVKKDPKEKSNDVALIRSLRSRPEDDPDLSCRGVVNASILARELGGAWQLCRALVDWEQEDEVWKIIREHCGNATKRCLEYTNMRTEAFCCRHCCPYSEPSRADLALSGVTTDELIYTMVSSVIVALILQVVSYVEIIIALAFKYVTMTRMTGVTMLLSGLFTSFALIANHYKIFVMNSQHRSLAYLPSGVLTARTVQVGESMWIAWTSVVFSILACVSWVEFSRYLVKQFYKVQHQTANPRPKTGRATTALSRKVGHHGNRHQSIF